jgi:hypothetical protein
MTTATTSTGRRAWIVAGSVLAGIALLFGTVQVIGVLARDTTTEQQVFPAEGVRLVDVGVRNGTIEVRGAETSEISLTAEIDHGLRRTSHRAAVEGDVLRVRASCPAFGTWCKVDYRLVVPARVAVSVDANNGRLIVRDVTGTVRADGDNGSIELARLSGHVDVSTDNGRVQSSALASEQVVARTRNGQVRLEFAQPPLRVDADSDNGRVDVVLPRTADAYRVDLDTENGSTDVAVRTDPASRRSVEGRTRNGDVTVRYPSG